MKVLLFGIAFIGVCLLGNVYGQTCWNGVICKKIEKPDTRRDGTCCRYPKGSAEGEANEPNCKDCVRVVEGNIPMVITIPHGGSLKPNNIKNRKNGCYNAIDKKCIYLHQCPDPSNRTIDKCEVRTKSDFKSDVMGFNIRNHIQQQTGKCPFIIMGNLHREKVDLNRDDNATNYEATFNEEIPKQVYKDYHGNITAVTQRLKNQFGHVFLVALHGYINDTKGVNWTALGYSLSSSDLISLPSKNAAELQEMAAKSSIKGLAERMSGTEDLTSLLYGPNSLGALLENEQLTIDGVAEDITAIPSPTNRSPRSSNDKDYFGATESPSVKNHLDRVDAAIQVEIEGDYRYHGANKNKTLTELYQKEFSRAFGNALIKFFVTYFDPCLSVIDPLSAIDPACNTEEVCKKGTGVDYTCRTATHCSDADRNINHASMEPAKSTYSSNECIIYTCDTGYQATAGEVHAICTTDGTWSGTKPTCTAITAITCSADDITHATRSPIKDPYNYNDEVTYTCDTGYSPAHSTSMTRKCAGYGWSGPDPICIECCSGVDIDHATRTPVKEVYTFGDTVTYQCIAGNVGTGTPLMTITCEDCQWSDSLPTCTVSCVDELLPHYVFYHGANTPNEWCSNNYGSQFRYNSNRVRCCPDRRYMKTLEVTNGAPWGSWMDEDFCPQGSYAIGYKMKIEGTQGDTGDDTSLNGIRLLCGEGLENSGESKAVSGEAPWGTWGTEARCIDGHFITSFKLQVESEQGTSGDDTAANYMQVRCRKFETTNDGLPTYPGTGRGYWGTYGDWSVSCAAKTAVCGIQTRIESSLGSGRDDTALNDVKLYCCDWDLQIGNCKDKICYNGGICEDLFQDYRCMCKPGFTGRHCEEPDCEGVNCNNGVCLDLSNDYRCFCEPNFTGKHCETDRRYMTTLEVTNGGQWGGWNNDDFCPQGSYAIGYNMKIEGKLDSGDDTSLNGIRLICGNGFENSGESYIVSGEAPWGDWGTAAKCSDGEFITSFKLQVESYQGDPGDDTAANYMQVRCRKLETANNGTTIPDTGNGHWGTYGDWSEGCVANTAVCGIQTKIEPPQAHGVDDTALNDVKLYCCQWDLVIHEFLVTLKDVVSPFKKEMANFGSPTFQAYVLSIKPMIDEMCKAANSLACEVFQLLPGSVQIQLAITSTADPTDAITTSLEDGNYTSFEMTSVTKRTVKCEKGQYLNNASNGCLECEKGSYSNFTLGMPCNPCLPGYYQDQKGQTQCKKCKAGNFSSTTGSEACTRCPLGHYSLEGSSNCTKCSLGTVAESEGQPSCVACNPGTEPNTESSHCKNCSAGTFSESGIECQTVPPGSVAGPRQSSFTLCSAGTEPSADLMTCLKCSAGTFSSNGVKCLPCGNGSYSTLGSEVCTPCRAGFIPYSDHSGCSSCPAGSFSNSGDQACKPCEGGSVSVGGQPNCTYCNPGTEPNEPKSECLNCSAGLYSRSGSQCLPCDQNQYSNTGAANCLLCANGSVPNSNNAGCTKCQPGYYAISGFAECRHCEDGTMSSSPGQSECIPCNGGYIPNHNNSDCNPCIAGTWSVTGDSSCTECANGTISSDGQKSCSECNNGSAPNAQKSNCNTCLAGTYAVHGFEQCLPCANGTFSTTGSADCMSCLSGSIPNSNQSGCDPCPPGNWSNSGDEQCRPCDAGSFSPGGQPNCSKCDAGTVPNINQSACKNCSAGFNSSTGDVECSPCPRDLWSLPGFSFCKECKLNEMPRKDQTGCVPSIAFNKPTKPKAKKYNSSDAVDGDFYNTCSRTKKTWKVVLDEWYKVKKVVMQSTKECCGYELQDLKVYVKQKNGKYKVCGKYTGPAATGERVYIKCDRPIVGKRVKIEKTSKGALVMCEVFVLGKQADPPKSGKKARKNRRKAKKAGRKEKNKN